MSPHLLLSFFYKSFTINTGVLHSNHIYLYKQMQFSYCDEYLIEALMKNTKWKKLGEDLAKLLNFPKLLFPKIFCNHIQI